MKYRVVIKSSYRAALFDFENIHDACNFLATAATSQVTNADGDLAKITMEVTDDEEDD